MGVTGIGIGIGIGPFDLGPSSSAAANLLNNDDLSSVSWTLVRATWGSGKLTENTAASTTHYIFDTALASDSGGVTAGTSYVFSVEAKPAGRSWIRLQLSGTEFGNQDAYFDVQNGVIGNDDAATSGISDAGDGYYLCYISATCDTSGTSGNGDIFLSAGNGDANVVYTGDGTSGVLLRNVKFQVGTEPT